MRNLTSLSRLAVAVLCYAFSRHARCFESNDRSENGQENLLTMTSDHNLAGFSDNFNSSRSTVMFWRPQKVGSSTVLSLLTSFGYRYNAPPRRKSPVVNSLCIRMARCALHDLRNGGSVTDSVDVAELLRYLEGYISRRAYPENRKISRLNDEAIAADKEVGSQPFKISSSHQICNLRVGVVKSSLQCTFADTTALDVENSSERIVGLTEVVKELFVVRNPLSRAISVYYFWGELFKMHKHTQLRSGLKGKIKGRQLRSGDASSEEENDTTQGTINYEEFPQDFDGIDVANRSTTRQLLNGKKHDRIIRLGSSAAELVRGTFTYHGNESSVPPLDIATAFARRLPYNAGMPGPSYTWSSFATDSKSAIGEIESDRMMTIVTERLSESLVAASHYFGWSLADMVVAAARKALSSHPKHTQWPTSAVDVIEERLTHWKEFEVYDAANRKLDQRISALSAAGVNVTHELHVLKVLQSRVTKLCMSEEYLILYRDKLQSEGYLQHTSNNKLRDSDEKFNRNGHCFSFNGEIMYSYDICGSCEAHAMLFAVKSGLASCVEEAPTLAQIDKTLLKNSPDFLKCL